MPDPVVIQPLALPVLLRLLRSIEIPHKLGICERLFARALSAQGTRWVRTAAGPLWKLDLTNATHRWIVYGGYEGPELWRWFRKNADGMRTIVDSGANIGQTVLTFCALAPSARVLAYEPGSAAREWLTEGVKANGFNQVSISPFGLAETEHKSTLTAVGPGLLHGSWNAVGKGGESIKLVTLDGEVERLGLAQVDFWKLDVEGYEIHALRGAARSLDSGKIRYLFMEIPGADGDVTVGFIKSKGYSVHRISTAGRLVPWNGGPAYANVLCIGPGETTDD